MMLNYIAGTEAYYESKSCVEFEKKGSASIIIIP